MLKEYAVFIGTHKNTNLVFGATYEIIDSLPGGGEAWYKVKDAAGDTWWAGSTLFGPVFEKGAGCDVTPEPTLTLKCQNCGGLLSYDQGENLLLVNTNCMCHQEPYR